MYNKEEIIRLKKEKQDKYWNRKWKIDEIRQQLKDLSGNKENSAAFRAVLAGIDIFADQLYDDHKRYLQRLENMSAASEVAEMQKALNREKSKNAELEKQISEARTSSGLFIKFVRDKFKI